MGDDLVKRLREHAEQFGVSHVPNICDEAADRIEQLEAALLEILKTFQGCGGRAYKDRYFNALRLAKRALDAKGMQDGGYHGVIAYVEARAALGEKKDG